MEGDVKVIVTTMLTLRKCCLMEHIQDNNVVMMEELLLKAVGYKSLLIVFK